MFFFFLKAGAKAGPIRFLIPLSKQMTSALLDKFDFRRGLVFFINMALQVQVPKVPTQCAGFPLNRKSGKFCNPSGIP